MKARDTPSRPRARSRTADSSPTVSIDEGGRSLFGGDTPSPAAEAAAAASGRAVDVGVAGWTPKEIKEMILTPAHIRRANTFDPTEQSPEERREESSGTPQKRKPRKRKAARKGSPGVGGDAYQLNMADAGILLVVLYAAFHLFRQMFGGAGSVNG